MNQDVFYIRPSTVQSALLCPGRAGYRGLPGYNEYPNEALLFGTLVHERIEREMKGESPTTGELLAFLDDAYRKDTNDKTPVKLSEVVPLSRMHRMIEESDDALAAWQVQVFHQLMPGEMITEQTIEREIGHYKDTQIVMRGTPDVVNPESGDVYDWKTAGKQWDKNKIEGQVQRIYYPWMAEPHYDTPFSMFTYWVYARDSQWWQAHPITTGTEIERVSGINTALMVARALITDSWTYQPHGQAFGRTRGWHCSPQYCDAWDICSGRHIIRDGKAELPAPTTKERWA